MATKKTSKKKTKTHLDIGSDPPVLVGGGGSSYVWVNLNQGQTPVNPSSNNPSTGINPGAPTPKTRANYTASRVTAGPAQVFFFDGVSEVQLKVLDRKTWYVRFA